MMDKSALRYTRISESGKRWKNFCIILKIVSYTAVNTTRRTFAQCQGLHRGPTNTTRRTFAQCQGLHRGPTNTTRRTFAQCQGLHRGPTNAQGRLCVLVFLYEKRLMKLAEMSDRSCCRVRVFLDYWNYELSMRTAEKRFKTDWGKIGPVLVEAAAKIVKSARPTEFQGLNFYGSYGLTEKEGRFNQWATNFVNTQPGVSVHMVRRQKKRAHPKCPMCHYSIKICPKCKADTRGTEEKGIDVRMATDMVKLAWEDNYDVAVLVSSDEDFVPVAEFLEDRGIKVIHGAFPPKGHRLSICCWGRMDIRKLRDKFRFQEKK